MKLLLTKILLVGITFNTFAQKDTIFVDAKNLKINNLHFGKSTYLIYTKKGKDQPAQNQTLVQMSVSKESHNGKDAVSIKQSWYEKDTISHTAFSLLNAHDLSTIQHNYWWKRTGQNISLDFEKKTANIEGKVSEIQKEKFLKDFNATTESGYFLNWHTDLVLFPLFPFKENAVFKVKFHDPGIQKPTLEVYKVIKSEVIEGTDCWVLEYTLPRNMGYQRFWIAKKAKEVIKEEDSFNGMFRYKFKMIVSE